MTINRNRPAHGEPGGCDCQICGCVFIGAPGNALCAVCVDPTAALNDVLRQSAERLELRQRASQVLAVAIEMNREAS